MVPKFKNHWPLFILFIISLLICLTNYTWGTFLSGWDTLHPEFNFSLNFQRTLFGVFRVEQGLGAVAGHSHMADLPRILFLFLLHFVTPLSFLRYSYIFLNLILGPIGIYLLLNKFFLKQKTASFLGGLFYLLNLGTLQTFNVPFEMFTTLYATLPFLFYFALFYLDSKEYRVKYLLAFAIISLLNSPSAYAATLWYVFFLCFFAYFFVHFLIEKKTKHHLKHFVILISVLLLTNFYWIIPNIYFVINHGQEIAHANINRLFSDQAFLKNKEFGNIKDILLLKSFYFDWSIYKGSGNFTDLLSPWINYLKDIKVLATGYLIASATVLGVFIAINKLKKNSLPLLTMLGISLFFLINDNFPVSLVYKFFQNHIPFFKEALRFPDDKIFNIHIFLGSIFFGFFALFAVKTLRTKLPKLKHSEYIFALISTVLIIFYMLPAFSGNFINKYMRVEIPKDYFNLFTYLNNEPDSLKVANLPIQSPWGWVYYNWYPDRPSYQGAGFLYFGIKQPLLDRDFDRWSPYNESYYREMSYAIYSQNKQLFINTVNKYKIGVVFIDQNVIDPQNQTSIMFYDQAKKLIVSSGLVKDDRIFGKIEAFRLNVNEDKINSLNTNINVTPSTNTTYEDFAFSTFGNYITTNSNGLANAYYPFRDLIDNQSKLHKNLIKIDADKITLIPSTPITNYEAGNLSQRINIIPSDLIAQKNGDSLDISIYPNTPVFDKIQSASTLKTTIATTNRKNISISINRNEFFNLDSFPLNTPFSAGKIMLNNNQDNLISAFDTNSLTTISGGLLAVNPIFSSCGNANAPTTGFTDNGVKIIGKGDICVVIPYRFLASSVNAQSLMVNLKFNLIANAAIESCLFDLNNLNCIHYDNPQRQGNSISITSILSSTNLSNTAMKLFIRPQNSLENNLYLQNISLSSTSSFADALFSKNDIANMFTSVPTLSFQKIYLSNNVIYDPGFKITQNNKLTNDCPSSLSTATKAIVTQDGQQAVEYNSLVGSFCDHFAYPNLPHNQGYLIGIYSKNKSGLPPTVCISNSKTQKCDIYSDLSSFTNVDRDVFLLPPMNDDGVGYNLNFENIGVKGTPSDNLIYSVQIIPIPYDLLLNVKSTTKNNNLFTGTATNIININPLAFIAQTDGNNTVLVLNYSFENGFKAYSISCSNPLSCFTKATLAPFYATELKTHVLVNNWANGWITNGAKQIAIVFLPQYFEAFGLLLIFFVFIYLILHLRSKNS